MTPVRSAVAPIDQTSFAFAVLKCRTLLRTQLTFPGYLITETSFKSHTAGTVQNGHSGLRGSGLKLRRNNRIPPPLRPCDIVQSSRHQSNCGLLP